MFVTFLMNIQCENKYSCVCLKTPRPLCPHSPQKCQMGELFPSAPIHLLDELFMREIKNHLRSTNPELVETEHLEARRHEDLSCRLNNVIAAKKDALSKITVPIKRRTVKIEAMPQPDIDAFVKRCLLSLDEETTYVITFTVKNPMKTGPRISKKNIEEALAKCMKCFNAGFLDLETNPKGDIVVTKRAGALSEPQSRKSDLP